MATALAAVGLAACGMAACAGPTAPTDSGLGAFAGTFALRSLDGTPVPALEQAYNGVRQYLVADTLSADGRGGYTRVQVTRIDSVGGAYSATQRAAWAGQYAVRGDTLNFPAQCPPGAMCVNTPVGWRTADGGLVLAYHATQGFASVSRFARVR